MRTSPVSILKEGTKRITGKEVQMSYLIAAKTIAQVVRSTLGPFGMDKMLVDGSGEATVTNDGAEILKKMHVTHPIGKIIVEVAKTQDAEVGDGTTSAVILAGSLLEKANNLVESGVHPNSILNGFKKASDKALEILEELSADIKPDDENVLKKIALTTLGSKGSVAMGSEKLADIAVKAVMEIAKKSKGKINLKDVRVMKARGESLTESELIMGTVIEGEVDVPNMPKKVENAKIVLLQHAIDLDKGEVVFSRSFEIDKPEDMKAFVEGERQLMTDMVSKVVEAGANVLLCEKAIDMYAVNYLVKHKILTVRRIEPSEMEHIAKAVGGRIITLAKEIKSNALGKAEIVEERKIGPKTFIYLRGCKSPTSVSVMLRAGENHVLDEAERSLHDALCAVRNAIEDKKIVFGGGACETEIAVRLKAYSLTFKGKEQLAIKAYADALDALPSALIENAGLDAIDLVLELKNTHRKEGFQNYGVDLYSGNIVDMEKLNVIEPLRVKKQMIISASEAANMILKIDDIIALKLGVTKEEGLEDRLRERKSRGSTRRRKWGMTDVQIVK